MGKPVLLFMYGISLWIVISRWYKGGGSGAPPPSVIGPASWLFGILLLVEDFAGGIAVVLGVGTTFILFTKRGVTPASGTPNASKGANATPQTAQGKNLYGAQTKKNTSMNLGGNATGGSQA